MESHSCIVPWARKPAFAVWNWWRPSELWQRPEPHWVDAYGRVKAVRGGIMTPYENMGGLWCPIASPEAAAALQQRAEAYQWLLEVQAVSLWDGPPIDSNCLVNALADYRQIFECAKKAVEG